MRMPTYQPSLTGTPQECSVKPIHVLHKALDREGAHGMGAGGSGQSLGERGVVQDIEDGIGQRLIISGIGYRPGATI
jgi:hypothetical protein